MSKLQNFWISLLGLLLGLGLGLLVAWLFAPVQYVDTTPATLRVDFKDEYRLLIASAFASNLDILRANARIGSLADQNPIQAIGAQAQRMMSDNSSSDDLKMLTDLSQALQITPTPSFTPTIEDTSTSTSTPTETASATVEPTQTATSTQAAPTVLSPTITVTPTATLEPTSTPTPKPIPTLAPRATQTLTPTPAAVFKLSKNTPFCDSTQPGLLKVNLTNSAGKPAAGIELDITWLGGDEAFFTGLKPEIGFGYADFKMADNTEYALSLSNGATRITGLTTSKCTDPQGGIFPGGILLEFKQP